MLDREKRTTGNRYFVQFFAWHLRHYREFFFFIQRRKKRRKKRKELNTYAMISICPTNFLFSASIRLIDFSCFPPRHMRAHTTILTNFIFLRFFCLCYWWINPSQRQMSQICTLSRIDEITASSFCSIIQSKRDDHFLHQNMEARLNERKKSCQKFNYLEYSHFLR